MTKRKYVAHLEIEVDLGPTEAEYDVPEAEDIKAMLENSMLRCYFGVIDLVNTDVREVNND